MSWVIAGKRVSAAGGYRQASQERYAQARGEHERRSHGAKVGWQTWKARVAERIRMKTEPNGILDRLMEVDKQVEATLQLVEELRAKLAESYQRNAHAQKIANDAISEKFAAVEMARRQAVRMCLEIARSIDSKEAKSVADAIRSFYPEYC